MLKYEDGVPLESLKYFGGSSMQMWTDYDKSEGNEQLISKLYRARPELSNGDEITRILGIVISFGQEYLDDCPIRPSLHMNSPRIRDRKYY